MRRTSLHSAYMPARMVVNNSKRHRSPELQLRKIICLSRCLAKLRVFHYELFNKIAENSGAWRGASSRVLDGIVYRREMLVPGDVGKATQRFSFVLERSSGRRPCERKIRGLNSCKGCVYLLRSCSSREQSVIAARVVERVK